MTYGEVIKRCDELVSNCLSIEYKIQLLFEFECSTMLSVMMLSQADIDALPEPTEDTELIIKRPYSKIYRLWLCAMIHKENGDYDDAANVTADFDIARREFVQWYGRNTAPGRGQAEYKGYYLSAYAIAKLFGFSGTVEEWLLSLIGPKGDAYNITANDYEEIAAYCAEHYDEKIAEMTAVLDKAKSVRVNAASGAVAGVNIDENDIKCVSPQCPYIPNLVRLKPGNNESLSGLSMTFFIPGAYNKAVICQRPIEKSDAIPVNDEEPVNELVAEIPDGRFIKADGDVKEENVAVFQTLSPCPKRALKSPTITFPREWFKSTLAVYIVG